MINIAKSRLRMLGVAIDNHDPVAIRRIRNMTSGEIHDACFVPLESGMKRQPESMRELRVFKVHCEVSSVPPAGSY